MDGRSPRRDSFSDDLRRHLLHRHRRNLIERHRVAVIGSAPVVSTSDTTGFGRYIRAARVNADLSASQLADQAGITVGTLLALEQGMISEGDIRREWVNNLAEALSEKTDTFDMLLDKQAVAPVNGWQRMSDIWEEYFARWLPAPVYATVPAILLFTVISIALFNQIEFPYLVSPPQQPVPTLSVVVGDNTIVESAISYTSASAEERLSLLKAEQVKILVASPTGQFELPTTAVTGPVVEPAPVDHSFLISKLNTLFSNQTPEKRVIYGETLLLSPVDVVELDGRPNVTNAEYRLNNQILVVPKVININSDIRQNMVKAEVQL
jgi:transcriptional regulator with XRE-family HTH domain